MDFGWLAKRRIRPLCSCHRAEIGCAYVLDAAQWGRLRTAGSQAREPGGCPGEHQLIARLIGRLAPASDRGF